MFQSHFYHETIRNTVVAFGTLFDDIKVQKLNADGTATVVFSANPSMEHLKIVPKTHKD